MITSVLKDSILNHLIFEGPTTSFGNDDAKKLFDIDRDYLNIILDYFEELGFVKVTKTTPKTIVELKIKAFDFYAHGGFASQEER
ncbi:hypothetical protein QEG73_01375 [Chitinophagaceae bacterium 26-R-25]|nr:hypothetical protein [Chitinophagaceae bacterium 26-R-25]